MRSYIDLKLKKFLEESNISIRELAYKCDMSSAFVSNVLNGFVPISPLLAVKVVNLYSPQYTYEDALNDFLSFSRNKFEIKYERELKKIKK